MKEISGPCLMILAALMPACIIVSANAHGYYTRDTAKTLSAGQTYDDDGGSDCWFCFTNPKDPCITQLRTCTWARAARVGAINTVYQLETANVKHFFT